MKQRIENWSGQTEHAAIEYDVVEIQESDLHNPSVSAASAVFIREYDKADRTDYIIAACSGLLTGMLDSFWVGEFSLETAQHWGGSKVNRFVIKIAHARGYRKNDLEGAVRFLEKDAPMASDQLTSVWGGGLQHHFRDFAHHASIVGLVFSVLTQFTGLSYGTNAQGFFEFHELPDKSLIGNCFEEKIYNGVILWFLHLVSDMAGSSSNAGKGTGIPGPILSLAKELSVLPGMHNLNVSYNGESISLSSMLSKIFNGTAFRHTSIKDLKRFDLRTEIGVYAYGIQQSVPVVVNQCLIRGFYFARRLYIEINSKRLNGTADINALDPSHFMPINNRCILRMATISSGVFCAVDVSDAAIRAFLSGHVSRRDFFTRLLLRTNMIGIGNFVISLKNDILGNLVDNDPVAEPESYEAKEAVLSIDSIDIDVSVEVDSSGIYEYSFYRMIEHVKYLKDGFSKAHESNRAMQTDIFKLEDDETALFDTVAKNSWHSLIVETEILIMRLFAFYGIEYIPSNKDEKYRYYVPFCRIEDGKKIAYTFTRSIAPVSNWKEIQNECGADGIKAVALVELGMYGRGLNDFTVFQERKSDANNIEHITLQDLFSLISDNEYQEYKSYVKKFNEDIRRLIGYRTIVVPSESSLNEMKADITKELKKIDFSSQLLSDGLYSGQVKCISGNFWKRGLYKAVTGNAAFAESFISSEWYYQTHMVSSALEQTAIVAGYLKSVEQLLYSLVYLSIGTGTAIKRKGSGKAVYIDFCEENNDVIDMSLGSMIGYVRHYLHLWDVKNYTKEYVISRLNVYRQYRNDYFHKDNITSTADIEEIRRQTLQIYYLLLGAMKISDQQKETIGIKPEKIIILKKRGLAYSELEKWLERILGGDVLLSPEVDIFFYVTPIGKDRWQLSFTTVSGFAEDGLPVKQEYPYIGDELIWSRRSDDKTEGEKQVIEAIRRFFKDGRNSRNLQIYRSVSVGSLWSHTLLYRR